MTTSEIEITQQAYVSRLEMLEAATRGLDLLPAQQNLLEHMAWDSDTRAQALAGLILQCRSDGYRSIGGM